MSRSSTARTLLLSAAGVTALALATATPAAAHTSNMYTYVTYDSMSEQAGFAVYGKTNGSIAPLATTFVPDETLIEGIEVFNERGTEIGYDSGSHEPFVREWDHSTGAAGAPGPVYVSVANPVFFAFHGLDTLPDGRTITVLEYSSGIVDHAGIATVDAGTGELVPLLEISQALFIPPNPFYAYTIVSLATHPITGITYVFLQNDSNWPYYLEVDLAAGTVGTPIRFEGDNMELGRVLGADFDADGTLFFNFEDQSAEPATTFELSTLPNGADFATASRSVVSTAPALSEQIQIAQLALTTESGLPATGAEFPAAIWAIGGAVTVLVGCVGVALVRRSRALTLT